MIDVPAGFKPPFVRPSGRKADELRAVSLTPGAARHAEGSCLIRFGTTEVLCTASVEGKVPPFLRGQGQGWVTAEYGMLPRATHTRSDREAARGKQSGRTQEIQRLIGRSLRAVTDLKAMGDEGPVAIFAPHFLGLDAGGAALSLAVVCTLVNFPCIALWAVVGDRLRFRLRDPRALRVFNYAMALLLAATAVWILADELVQSGIA